MPQSGGGNSSALNAEIGGQDLNDREVQFCIAPKRQEPRSVVAPAAQFDVKVEFGANASVTERSNELMPQSGEGNLSAEIGGQNSLDREVHALSAPKRRGRPPKVAPAAPVNAESGGHLASDQEVQQALAAAARGRQSVVVPATLQEQIDRLVILQRQRRFCIRSQSKMERSTEAFIARELGYRPDLPEAAGKAIWARAASIRKTAEAGGEESQHDHDRKVQAEHALFASHRLIIQSAMSRAPWDGFRKDVETEMEAVAKALPVWPWVSGVKGFAAKGLAIIIAEAGADLRNYSKKEKLWKRLGLAVINGKRQGNPGKGADAQDWLDHGYNPARRAEIWAIADSMFKHQWAGDKDEDGGNPLKTKKPVAVPAHATGPYGEVYGTRKMRTSNTIILPKHKDNDARRVMTKRLIRDLWREWRRVT